MDNQNVIDEVRLHSDIVDVISSYIPLTQKGKNYFGVCPFHDDQNPSMSVSKDLQIYKCFACGASGNVFNFVMDYEHVTFREALNILGERAGIKVSGNFDKGNNSKNEPYYKVLDLALKFYQNNINTTYGKKAKEYLYGRGITEEIIKEFGIGLSLKKNDTLTKLLEEKGYSIKVLNDLGLSSNTNDTYINRIMFPLHDLNGRCIGFSGRIYNNEDTNKYLNTKETPIFKKGELIYNYHIARDAARTKKYVIVMEGFMDVIRASTIGYKNVVALMGTAMTKEQANLIKRLSNDIILCFDGDDAGLHADLVNGEALTKLGLNPKVIVLSDNEDPDTYILKNGKSAFDRLVKNAIPWSDYKIDSLKKNVNMKSDLEVANYINNVIKEASIITDEIRKEIILKNLAKEFDLEYNTLEKRLSEYKNKEEVKETKPVIQKETKKVTKYNKASMAIIYYMLKDANVIDLYEEEELILPTEEERLLANEISYYYEQNENLNVADIITYLGDKKDLIDLLTDILSMDYKDNLTEEELMEYVSVIKEYGLEKEIERLKKLQKEEPNAAKQAQIGERIRKLKMGVE